MRHVDTWKDWQEAQPQVVPMLVASIQKNRLAHAYLFEGEAGSGKHEVALLMAKRFFCKEHNGAEPCHACSDCLRIEHGNHPDVHQVAPDGQSIKKEQIEYLQKEFTYRGMESAAKVYIVSHVDKMTASAANSLLKFLEEPQGQTLAILLTENGASILPTIRSRAQQMRFLPPSQTQIASKLVAEGIEENQALFLAALTGNKAYAKALAEGDWSFQARTVVLQLMHELFTRPDLAAITLADKWIPLMKERLQQEMGLEMMLLWLRDLLYIQAGKQDKLVYADNKSKFDELALSTSQHTIRAAMSHVLEAKRHLSANVSIQLVMERLLFTIQEG
ncbi:DNA polymerase III subunit delta' [Shouchella clausii]|uniref:DNA polymerase III subunit delta' n=2 Tax=Shouchella clausii TaxID=79880 RepID=Q5WLY0_SHOC1|nr:DNA polymerase III subunit delta' [Shouchella clausii]PAD42373.1 DNA polymerase III subunit delta' [Bacillus sp. 7520-S]BAD62595.1 DNA polymerase III delta' subunit HolB [Shouchella clausii KSM-K16]PAD45443.1 DNA polymerase III subunit delta' [Shouchella clausii]PAE79665.1 DNA polymerase III subunit delta' [Shouchella clausii]